MDSTESSVRPAPPGQDSDPNLCTKALNYTAVPRRPSSKEKYESLSYPKDIAPMGFEPEGSPTKPRFCEGNSSLLDLLSDRSGYSLFREYLRAQKQESLLDFWQSCEEYKRLAASGSNLATSKANSTYSNYMQSKHVCAGILPDVIRAKVKHGLSSGQSLNESLFDHAKECVFSYMSESYYGRFLASDVYNTGDVSKSKDRVSSKSVTRLAGKALPSLPEGKVFEQMPNWQGCDVNTRSLGRHDEERQGYVPQSLSLSKAALAGMYMQPAPPVVSVEHSDVQSLSSDALTDDTKSTVTDFSDLTAKSNEKKHRPGFQDVQGFLPRTKKLLKTRKQLSPEEFAKILIEKLEKVLIEREQDERKTVNLDGLPHEFRENKKSILEDAVERHHQYQQAGRFGLPLPPPKFSEPCFPVHSNMPQYVPHPGYVNQQEITGYYQAVEPADGCWCEPDPNKQAPLNNKKQWESVGTLESAPDSGVNMQAVEEDPSLPPEARNRILQWMEHSEKEVQHEQEHYNKNSRSKQTCPYNPGMPIAHSSMLLQPIAQDPLMPPLAQPDSRNTIEEASRRLKQKDMREKRSKSHKNRTSCLSSKSSQAQFSGDPKNCSSSIVSGDHRPAAIYNSSSVLSSVPSTVNSKDSGLGGDKNNRLQQGIKIVYYLDGEKYPYQSVWPESVVVLRQFKELIAFKKGNYRYFFKTKTDEEDCGAVYEEIRDDNTVLPCYGDKIICKVKESKCG